MEEDREGDERRRKKIARHVQKSLQLLVMARCDLRDKPIRKRTRNDAKHSREK